MYSENSKTSDPHNLLINISARMNLKKKYKYVALSNLSKNIKKSWKIVKK